MSAPRKKLPIGIQTFREIREEGHYYVDKTPFALQLIEEGKYYFLSRPRRFGKSLFLDTLKELFEGHQGLFTGLAAETRWDWSVQYPVIRLSFGSGVLKSPERLELSIINQLTAHEQRFDLTPAHTDAVFRFQHLIRNLHQLTGQRVVVLVDEYDKPILDNLQSPDLARTMRDGLRNLYSVIKDSDAHIKFVLITGVSKFSKVNLFSGLNNLEDITLSPRYSAICGYTDHDLDAVFAPELPGLDRAQIQAWYNGYNWRGEAVYNPFDLLLLFREREFKAYWFETGTPTFLVNFLAERQWFTPDLGRLQTNEALLSSFDVEQIAPEALLWQTGYLTIHKIEERLPGHWFYTLGYPNREVEAALNDALLPAYGPASQGIMQSRADLIEALQSQDLLTLRNSMHRLFASIPADWYRRNPLAQYEGHYASVFYSQLAALGLDLQGEDVTNASVVGDLWSRTNEDSTRYGRIDLSLKFKQQIYLFEFKVVETEAEGKALQQLIDKGYAEKYRAPGISITLIGIEFSKTERNAVAVDAKHLTDSDSGAIVGWETQSV